MHAALSPQLFIALVPRLCRGLSGPKLGRGEGPAAPVNHGTPMVFPVCAEGFPLFVRERAIAGRQGKLGRALKYREVFSGFRDLGDGLHARRTRANYRNVLPFKGYGLVGPAPRVIDLPSKVVDARNVRPVGDKERPRGADQKLRGGLLSRVCFDGPTLGFLVVARVRHPGVELDVLPKVQAVGDEFQVGQHGPLGGLGFGPVPCVNEVFREGVGIEGRTRGIHARPGIAVIPPGPTDAAGAVENPNR